MLLLVMIKERDKEPKTIRRYKGQLMDESILGYWFGELENDDDE